MRKALFAGTFDPPTLGHLDIILRASRLFDALVVGIAKNTAKNTFILSEDERKAALQELTNHSPHIEVKIISGLVTEFAKGEGVNVLIRGVRSSSDLENEQQMAWANRAITGIETLFIPSDQKAISSTLIKELASHGAPLKSFLPEMVEKKLHNRIQQEK